MNSPRRNLRLIRNELLARRANKRVKRVIREHTPASEQPKLKIDFYCECADASCKARVPLTIEQYEKFHNSHARFVVAKGHVAESIERVAKSTNKLEVVEKYALKPEQTTD